MQSNLGAVAEVCVTMVGPDHKVVEAAILVACSDPPFPAHVPGTAGFLTVPRHFQLSAPLQVFYNLVFFQGS